EGGGSDSSSREGSTTADGSSGADASGDTNPTSPTLLNVVTFVPASLASSARSLFVIPTEGVLVWAAGNAAGNGNAGVWSVPLNPGTPKPTRHNFNATGFVYATNALGGGSSDYWVTVNNGASGSCELTGLRSGSAQGTSIHADTACNASLM